MKLIQIEDSTHLELKKMALERGLLLKELVEELLIKALTKKGK